MGMDFTYRGVVSTSLSTFSHQHQLTTRVEKFQIVLIISRVSTCEKFHLLITHLQNPQSRQGFKVKFCHKVKMIKLYDILLFLLFTPNWLNSYVQLTGKYSSVHITFLACNQIYRQRYHPSNPIRGHLMQWSKYHTVSWLSLALRNATQMMRNC